MIWRKKEWKCRGVHLPGSKGTLREWEKYGDELVCVRYRYDENGMRIKTVELVVSVAKVAGRR